MNLTFYKEPFHIPDEWKITLWRYNLAGKSPLSEQYTEPKKWDKNAKAVSADKPGIFCVQEGQVLTGYAKFIYWGFVDCAKVNFLKIEADKRDILFINSNEVAISRGNIVEVLTHKQFGKRFPVFPHVTNVMLRKDGIAYYREGCAMMREYFKEAELTGEGVFSLPDGFPHSLRVDKGINLLCRKMAVKNNVSAFAYWHDVMKSKDHDPEHGERASEVIEQSRGRNKLEMVDVDRLSFACKHHSTMLRSGDTLIDICFDADRLDLPYRGITPDPDLMATEIGSYYAEHYDEYLREIMKTTIE
ncbi:hypothetical protein JS578_05130 [Dysgonomonadaceae bacterium zrk40]|nr:hypothetical protein JS578_05130 [Dysgonomonadaceae bacterium zrk40]